MDTALPALIPFDALERVAPALRVLAHPVRLRMVELLLQEPIPVGTLAERVHVRPAVASQHLNIMRAHGVVRANRRGKQVFYEVVSDEAKNLIACIRLHHT